MRADQGSMTSLKMMRWLHVVGGGIKECILLYDKYTVPYIQLRIVTMYNTTTCYTGSSR